MAEMIPDRLPGGASAGEKKVFALLQQLPDEVIAYYEPVIAGRYPDFIVIIPSARRRADIQDAAQGGDRPKMGRMPRRTKKSTSRLLSATHA